MKISVAICTWNRAGLLDQTLAEMTRLRAPADVEWELLVVNNNCTDATDQVIAKYAGRLPLRRLLETKQGLSNARNCAVAAAAGELLIWTDDDVLVDEDWLEQYVTAARRWPGTAFFGGPIRPWFEGVPPRWLSRAWSVVADAYAIRDLGTETIALGGRAIPFGANYAVRTDAQRRYLYDPTLGRNKTGLLGGEEVSVLERMLAAGAEGRWVPGARVRHFIPVARQNTRYIRRFFEGYGQFLARAMTDDRCPRLFGKPRWLWRQAVQHELQYRFHRLFSKPETWTRVLITTATVWGKLRGFPYENLVRHAGN
jgi:glycosyltransferase involved in cell wall biosynthesis